MDGLTAMKYTSVDGKCSSKWFTKSRYSVKYLFWLLASRYVVVAFVHEHRTWLIGYNDAIAVPIELEHL